MFGMESIGAMLTILCFVVAIAIAIAPLYIWRNTNRANRLLALIAMRSGCDGDEIKAAWTATGGQLTSVPGLQGYGMLGVAKKTVESFRQAVSEQPKTKPSSRAEPKNRYCQYCDTTAARDALACPTCAREFPARAVFCPRCGHEITHMPKNCPGCGAAYKYKTSQT